MSKFNQDFHFRDLPLRFKLGVFNILTGSLALIGVTVLISAFEFYNARESLLDELRIQAEILADNISGALIFDDSRSGQEIIGSLRHSPSIQSATVFYKTGKPFVHASLREGEDSKPSIDSAEIINALIDQERQGSFSWSTAHLFREVYLKGRLIGYVLIISSLSQVYSDFLKFMAIAIAVAFVVLCSAFLLLGRLQLWITGPLLDLTLLMREVSSRADFTRRCRIASQDEIGELCRGFNAMLEQIDTMHLELKSELHERTQAELRLDRLAHFDSLTGLPNRNSFNHRFKSELAAAEGDVKRLAVMFVDLDNFKYVNDTFGHHIGDELLHQVSGRMMRVIRHADKVFRLGGDEFAVLMDSLNDPSDAGVVARKIIESLKDAFVLFQHEVYIGASVGIAIYPESASDPDSLLRSADAAMYYAKAKGKNNFQFFSPAMGAKVLDRGILQNKLRKAIEREELSLLYQPQVDLASGRVISVEAVIRWREPERGVVEPSEFIPLAEESGFIKELGNWILRTACQQAKTWHRVNIPLVVAVNVSGRQIDDEDWYESTVNVLAETDFDPGFLELEITESALMDTAVALPKINLLKDLGIRLSIDDFGTGYSSMSYLRRLPISKLKIDRSFVRDLPDNREDLEITKAIIAIAQNLGLQVIAEGVETKAQADCLRDNGCNIIQGYFISRPLPPQEIPRLFSLVFR